MAELKTKANNLSINNFLDSITDEEKRSDCYSLLNIMHNITEEEPKMWGDSIVGFGKYHYKYESGREGDWFITGFSPRKSNLTLYLMAGFNGYENLLKKLGKHKTGQSCLYIKKLSDIDVVILSEMLLKSTVEIKHRYPVT